MPLLSFLRIFYPLFFFFFFHSVASPSPLFSVIVSVTASLIIPGDGRLTPGIRSQRMGARASHHCCAISSAVSFSFCAESCSRGTVSPKGIPTRDNGQLIRVNNSLFHAIFPQRHRRDKKRRSANIAQTAVVGRSRKKLPQCAKASQTHSSWYFRHLESMATQSHSQYVIVAPAASLI